MANFFLNYPLSGDVLQNYLNFIFKNMMNSNVPTDGRLALINMVTTIISKFPHDFLNEKVNPLIHSLLTSL